MEIHAMQVRDIPGVLVSAARILGRFWVPFVVLACAGIAVRNGALWLAVVVSDVSGLAAQLILILAPLGFLGAMIAMLYLTRDSLPNVAELGRGPGRQAATENRELRLVDVAVSVLVPFLAVYVSYGLLKEDLRRFTNQAAYDEITGFGLDQEQANFDIAGRLGIHGGVTILVIVAVAWVLRYALGKLEKATKFLALAFVGALVEVYYTSQVAQKVTLIKDQAFEWVRDRRSTSAVIDGYTAAVGDLGQFAKPVNTTMTWLGGLVGAVDAVVVVPLAWVTVGAVVLGHKIAPPKRASSAAARRVPGPVVGVARELAGDVRERWSAFWNGLRLMATAGLVPMLTFALVFLVVLRLPWLLGQAVRWAVGPTETRTWLAFAPVEEAVGLALTMVLAAALLAAAIDWLLGPQLALREATTEVLTAAPRRGGSAGPTEVIGASTRQNQRDVPRGRVPDSELYEMRVHRRHNRRPH